MGQLRIGLFRITGAHIGVSTGGAENIFREIISAQSGLTLADDLLLAEKGDRSLLRLGCSGRIVDQG